MLISLTATCKALGVDPYAYLRDVLERISTHPFSRLDELLPDRWEEDSGSRRERGTGGVIANDEVAVGE